MQQILFIVRLFGAGMQRLQKKKTVQISIKRKWFRIYENFILSFFQRVSFVNAECCSLSIEWWSTQLDRWLVCSRNSFGQFAVGHRNRKDSVHFVWTRDGETKKNKTNNNSNHPMSKSNWCVSVFGTWWETWMLIVNIKTCHRHDVIGHITYVYVHYAEVYSGCMQKIARKS